VANEPGKPNGNGSSAAIIAERRMLVARLRARGLTEREIVRALAAESSPVRVNPHTGQPWSLGTVCSDLKVLIAEWRERALGEIATLRGNQLAEVAEIKRKLWAEDFDAFALLKALEREAKLLGLDKAQAMALTAQITGAGGGPIEFTWAGDLPEGEGAKVGDDPDG